MSTLYEISEDLKAVEELLIEQGGDLGDSEDEDVVMRWLTEHQDKLDDKLERYGRLIHELMARGKARTEEAARLRARGTVDVNAAKRLKERLLWFMQERNMKKIETPSFKYSVSKNGGMAPLEFEEAHVPEEYRTSSVDTGAIRKALDDGQELEFARYLERGTSLRMR